MGRIIRGARVVTLESRRALMEADLLLADARREAEALRRQAGEDLEQLRRRVHAEALEAARSEAAALIAAASLRRERLLASVRQEAITLAIEVARKLVGRELELRPELAAELFAEALRPMVLAAEVTLRVNPQDLSVLEAKRELLLGSLGEGASLRVVADEAIGPGGCVVESETGRIDARLETQLAAIKRALESEDD